MLKKISKIFPVLFLVASLGVLFLTNTPKTQFVEQVLAGDQCPNYSCPEGTTIQKCTSSCMDGYNAIERWGTCCDSNHENCDAGHWDSVDCTNDYTCSGGACVPIGEPGTCTPDCIAWNASTDSCGDAVIRCPIECSGLSRTYYCTSFTCNDEGGVTAERCDQNAVAWENGGGASGSSNIQDGKILYQDKLLSKDCFVKQTDYYSSFNGTTPVFTSYKGHSMGNRNKSLDECLAEPEITPMPPAANFSGDCYPTDQTYNDLSYRFSLNNITGTGDFKQATLFLSFSQGNPSAAAETAFKTFFGEPTWTSGSWYGYWLDRQSSMNNNALDFRTWDEQIIIGGNKGNQKTIDDLVDQTQTWVDSGLLTSDFTYGVEASVTLESNGEINKTNSVGGSHVAILPNACAEPIAPQCTNIQMFSPSNDPITGFSLITDFSTLTVGQLVGFQCESSPADDNQFYKYRVVQVDSDDPTLGHVIENFSEGYMTGLSGPFDIPGSAQYFAQCVTCIQNSDSEFNCAEWESIPNLTVVNN